MTSDLPEPLTSPPIGRLCALGTLTLALAISGCGPAFEAVSGVSFGRGLQDEAGSAGDSAPPVADDGDRNPALDPTVQVSEDEIEFVPAFQPTETPIPTAIPPTSTPWPTATVPPTPTPDPLAEAGAPLRLEVPALGIDSFVEHVGLTPDRAMDVPKGFDNVGWYMHGARPGEVGNAVIAGHLDTTSGGPAVFWDLDRLLPGDEVHVTYENGDRYTFVVQDAREFEYDAEGEAIDVVFGASRTPDLNLITCRGDWDRGRATYSKRLVVFTELAPERTVRVARDGAFD